MPPSFKLSLKLALPEVFRGESDFFDVSLKNEGTEAATGIRSFDDDSGGLSLVLTPQGAVPHVPFELGAPQTPGQKIASAHSFQDREGVHVHGPDSRDQATLAPGAQWSARGDILEWFGEVAPGSYTLVARFNSGYDIYESSPLPLKILPIKPILGAAARNGTRHFAARPASTPEGKHVFVQVSSDALPKTPFRGIRLSDVGEPVELRAATSAVTSGPVAHVLVSDGKGWSIGVAPLDGKPGKVSPLASPIPGTVLASPLSHSDGGVVVPFTDAALAKLFMLRFAPDGGLTAAPELDISRASPIGPYACCWENEQAFHFVWAAAKGREVWHASRSITDLDQAGPAPRQIFAASGPILWLDAWIDTNAALGARPMFVENGGNDPRHAAMPLPLTLKVWCITASPSHLTCTEYSIADVRTRVAANFKLDKEQKFTVLHSVVRHTGEIGVLLHDTSGGELWYASTGAGRLAPLREWGAKGVTNAHSPSLFACSSRGTLPWVYLRHLDQNEGRVAWTKLEPLGEEEPGEHAHGH
jgi:hypothetical protein